MTWQRVAMIALALGAYTLAGTVLTDDAAMAATNLGTLIVGLVLPQVGGRKS